MKTFYSLIINLSLSSISPVPKSKRINSTKAPMKRLRSERSTPRNANPIDINEERNKNKLALRI